MSPVISITRAEWATVAREVTPALGSKMGKEDFNGTAVREPRDPLGSVVPVGETGA